MHAGFLLSSQILNKNSSDKMRIAIFTDTYYPEVNGVVVSIMNSTRLLAEKGHKIRIFAPSYTKGRDKGTDALPILHKNIRVERYFSLPLATYKDVRIVLPNVYTIIKKVNAFKPDIIHVHTPSNMGITGITAGKMLKVPVMGTFHTLVTEQLTYVSLARLTGFDKLREKIQDRLSGSDRTGFRRLLMRQLKVTRIKKDRKGSKGTGSERVVWYYLAKFYNRCDCIVTPTAVIKEELVSHGVAGKKICVVSNGIDLNKFDPKKDYALKNIIVHVGRVGFEKNIDVVIKAFKTVAKENPKLKLVIAGSGPAEESLKRLTKRLRLTEKVIFVGYIEHSGLKDLLAESDVFVTASTMETQGLVILEAMASGLPVVGVRKYAIPEMVKEWRNGFIAEPFKPQQMAHYISLLLKDKTLRQRIGRTNVHDAKKHDLCMTVRKLHKAYQKCL
jgi:1,2-diacylglycerol 3-alpha-glucosyltransferase